METEIDRVAALFPAPQTHRARPAKGLRFLAEAIGVSPGALSKWRKRHAGEIPAEYRARVLAAADAHGVSRAALADIWGDGWRCPTCGQLVAPGAVHA
jgi:hypothetical protein